VGVQQRTQELADSHDSLTMLLFPVGQSLGAPHGRLSTASTAKMLLSA
jgi:hypothetical protein